MEVYQLIPTEGMTWNLDPDQLMEQIPTVWPDADISCTQPADTLGYRLYWNIIFDPKRDLTGDSPLLSGWLTNDLRRVALHGDFEPAVEFAIWFRSLLSHDQSLVFEDETHTYHIQVLPETSKLDILRVFAPEFAPLEWQILSILKECGGIETANTLLEQLQLRLKAKQSDQFLAQVDHAISQLWQSQYISSPSINWVAERPAIIHNIVTNEYWTALRISLTSIGERAILARSALQRSG